MNTDDIHALIPDLTSPVPVFQQSRVGTTVTGRELVTLFERYVKGTATFFGHQVDALVGPIDLRSGIYPELQDFRGVYILANSEDIVKYVGCTFQDGVRKRVNGHRRNKSDGQTDFVKAYCFRVAQPHRACVMYEKV